MDWIKTEDLQPTRQHADTELCIWAFDGLQVKRVTLSQFERGHYTHWQPRPRVEKPQMPTKIL